MGYKPKDIELLIEEAMKNIRDDRAMADVLLIDIVRIIKENKHEFKDLGLIAAKYLETLQRSNEQLVKLVATLNTKRGISGGNMSHMTQEDKEEIFDIIQNSKGVEEK